MNAEQGAAALDSALKQASVPALIAFVNESKSTRDMFVLFILFLKKCNQKHASLRCVCKSVAHESTPLFVSRNLLQTFADSLPKLPQDVHMKTALQALTILQVQFVVSPVITQNFVCLFVSTRFGRQPRMVAFEEQVAVIREKLADL